MGTGKEIKRELSARAVPFGFFTFSDQHIVNGEVFNYEKFTATARLYRVVKNNSRSHLYSCASDYAGEKVLLDTVIVVKKSHTMESCGSGGCI